jgi:hypothetical protein
VTKPAEVVAPEKAQPAGEPGREFEPGNDIRSLLPSHKQRPDIELEEGLYE